MGNSKVDSIFQKAQEMGASDVHFAVGSPVIFRINGELTPISKGELSTSDVKQIIEAVLGADHQKRFEENREIDSSYTAGAVRLRINALYERGNPSIVVRLIPEEIPTLEEVDLQDQAGLFTSIREGLILFTGPTGAGKSTSLAALINTIRQQRPVHIMTLEDPIEFIFPQEGEGLVRQRQYGEDFVNFGEALKHVLRQDPDVVMVGEMRDLETIAAALTLAETGHIVFGTLHTPNTMQTIDRIIDVFPSHQQGQVRSQLSLSLKAIVAQRLLPKEEGGRVALREILINTPAVGHIIRENRIPELVSVLQTSGKDGMITFDAEAKRLHKEGLISDETLDLIMGVINSGKK